MLEVYKYLYQLDRLPLLRIASARGDSIHIRLRLSLWVRRWYK